MRKKLLFIHNAMPAEGISGMVIFLRHFKKMHDWDIHIAIPENAYREELADSYPANFFVHTFPLRKKYWPPFSLTLPFLARIRFWNWALEIEKTLAGIQPDIVISVLAHFFSVSAAILSKKIKRPFYLFIHDNWALSEITPKNDLIQWAHIPLQRASRIFPVSSGLVSFYGTKYMQKTTLLYPIPNGFKAKAVWREEIASNFVLMHGGTADNHVIAFFNHILKNDYLQPDDLLEVVYDDFYMLRPLLQYPQYRRTEFFEKIEDLMQLAVNHASALLIYYGAEEGENRFGMDSFPSRFAEFSHTGLPIICIAAEHSEFYRFLKNENWPLLFCQTDINELETAISLLKTEEFWSKCSLSTTQISRTYFDPDQIHHIFSENIVQYGY